MYIKESRVIYTIYNSRTTEPIWMKIGGSLESRDGHMTLFILLNYSFFFFFSE